MCSTLINNKNIFHHLFVITRFWALKVVNDGHIHGSVFQKA